MLALYVLLCPCPIIIALSVMPQVLLFVETEIPANAIGIFAVSIIPLVSIALDEAG